MTAGAFAPLRDLGLAVVLVIATALAVRIGVEGDLTSALVALGAWGAAIAIALGAPPAAPEQTAPALRLLGDPADGLER